MSKAGTVEGSVFQDRNGNWWLHRSDRAEDQPLTELEVRSFIQGIIEHATIADMVDDIAAKLKAAGIPLPDHVRETVIRNTHKAARKHGITKTGSLPDFTKLIG